MSDVEGLDNVLKALEMVGSTDEIMAAMGKACALVVRTAIQKAPKGSGGSSGLGGSIKSKVETDSTEVKGIVYTPLEYAPYVEYGTGLFAEGGNGKKEPWYIPIGNDFTESDAKRYGYQIIKGKNGMKWAKTTGAKPHPFLRPALNENREKILQILKEGIGND